jgi:hypothetical protein
MSRDGNAKPVGVSPVVKGLAGAQRAQQRDWPAAERAVAYLHAKAARQPLSAAHSATAADRGRARPPGAAANAIIPHHFAAAAMPRQAI